MPGAKNVMLYKVRPTLCQLIWGGHAQRIEPIRYGSIGHRRSIENGDCRLKQLQEVFKKSRESARLSSSQFAQVHRKVQKGLESLVSSVLSGLCNFFSL
jgi:hypothetical protein